MKIVMNDMMLAHEVSNVTAISNVSNINTRQSAIRASSDQQSKWQYRQDSDSSSA